MKMGSSTAPPGSMKIAREGMDLKMSTSCSRTRVREQLVDIFKSIPSLAIFMLPGGAVLLPIFIKLIPRLLPSSFDENRVDREAE